MAIKFAPKDPGKNTQVKAPQPAKPAAAPKEESSVTTTESDDLFEPGTKPAGTRAGKMSRGRSR